MSVKLSPFFNDQTFDANGNLANGYKLFVYAAGSSTKQTSYTDSTGGTPQTNPIILNSFGYPTLGPIWMTAGLNYKFVLCPPTDTDPPTSPVKTIDNVSGVNDASIAVSQWIASGVTPTYISATSFSLVGDQTTEFHVGRRLQFTTTAGTVYGTIATTAYTVLTTVTMTMDSAQVLDSGLSAVNLSVLRNDHTAVPSSYARSGANADITSITGLTTPLSVSQGGLGLPTILAPVASNIMTITLNPIALSFRSATLATGTPNTRTTAAISLAIPNGATLGATNGVLARFYVLAIDNAGTVELAVTNALGGLILDETGLISTTAISGSSTSISTIYSTTSRSNVPYRVVGFVESTQATAGTYATTPSLIQGMGGQVAGVISLAPYIQLINNTSAGSDVSLQIGQAAYVDFSAATSIPLHIATGDNQVYELIIEAQGGTGNATDPSVTLNPNNATFTNFFHNDYWTLSGAASSQIGAYTNGFMLGRFDPRLIRAVISTKTISKNIFSQCVGYTTTGPAVYLTHGASEWLATASTATLGDTTTAWTSLGTLVLATANTGRVIVRRLA